jgi:Bacterial Ig-like domain (group 3)/FG-GAP-like repeat/FG-GAP repeat
MFSRSMTMALGGAVLTLMLASAPSRATSIFKPAVGYDSGAYKATSMALADVNGDGKLDLVVANDGFSSSDPGGVSILLGNGDGTFQPATICYPQATSIVVAADLNGDHKIDLIVESGPSVGVLLGNGDGTFQPVQVFGAGGVSRTVSSIVVQDLNGDDKPDIIAANNCLTASNCGNDFVGVLIGKGDGTFKTVRTFVAGGGGVGWLGQGPSVAVADVNGDHKPDLLVTNPEGSVGVLLGKGDGTFKAAHTYPSSSGQFAIAIADVNGDNKLDLLLAGSGEVGVLLGNGDGTFQPVKSYSSGVGGNSIAVADVNRDSKLDVLVSSYCVDGTPSSCAKGGVNVLLGNGDGTFQAPQLYLTGGDFAWSILAADVNGDGKPDLLAANWSFKINSKGQFDTDGWISVALNKSVSSTTTSLSSNPNPSVFGQSVTLAATVGSVGPMPPTGTVIFNNGTTEIGKGALSGEVATVSTSKLPEGTLSITASYSGDSQSAKSTSAILDQVNAAQ